MDERTAKESRGLAEKIAEVVGKLELPPNASKRHINSLDCMGKYAAQRGDYKDALIRRAQAAMLYFENEFYYEAANSADRAANASHIIQINAKDDNKNLTALEKVLTDIEAYLSELAGNCYLEINERENAVFAYLKAAKGYAFELKNRAKAEELLEKALKFDIDIGAIAKNKAASKMYEDTMFKIESLKPAAKS